jgi:hypothetical protein
MQNNNKKNNLKIISLLFVFLFIGFLLGFISVIAIGFMVAKEVEFSETIPISSYEENL